MISEPLDPCTQAARGSHPVPDIFDKVREQHKEIVRLKQALEWIGVETEWIRHFPEQSAVRIKAICNGLRP